MIAEEESKYFQIRKDTVYAIVTLYLIGTMVSFVTVNTIFFGYELFVMFLNLNFISALLISGWFIIGDWRKKQNSW
jgi:ABC-type thiamin/hydroxymethylpyrimidine transport system permease subunit